MSKMSTQFTQAIARIPSQGKEAQGSVYTKPAISKGVLVLGLTMIGLTMVAAITSTVFVAIQFFK